MATPFDFGLIQDFSSIFVVVLVFAMLYGALSMGKMFNASVNSIISVVIALLMLVVPNLIEVIKIAMPWFTVVVILTLMLIMVAKMFGSDDHDIKRAFASEGLMYWFITAAILIIIFSLGKVYFTTENGDFNPREAVDVGDEVTFSGGFWATLFHPNVLGFLFVMLIAVFTVILLTSPGRGGGHGDNGHDHH
jgi:hypothetical protein